MRGLHSVYGKKSSVSERSEKSAIGRSKKKEIHFVSFGNDGILFFYTSDVFASRINHKFQEVAVGVSHVHTGAGLFTAALAFDWTFDDLCSRPIQQTF